MTPDSPSAGFQRLADAVGTIRRRALLAYVGLGLAGLAAIVLLLSLTPLSPDRASWLPAVGWLVATAGGGWLIRVALRARAALTATALARQADTAAGLGDGDTRAALELEAATSTGLAGLHRQRVGSRLASIDPSRLLPGARDTWRGRALRAGAGAGGAMVLLAASALVRPEPTRAAAAALAAPWRAAFPPPLPRLEVTTVGDAFERGQPVDIEIAAPGRSAVSLRWRIAGEPAERVEIAVELDGRAVGRTSRLEAPMEVWAEDPSGSSDTLKIRPAEPLLVEDLTVRIEYPRYLGRETEEHRGQIPALLLPEGSALQIDGRTNVPLDVAGLMPLADGTAYGFDADGPEFTGRIVPRRSGRWSWNLQSSESYGSPVLPEALELRIVPDLPPRIDLLFPAPDTVLGSDRTMPLVVDVDDDIGLRAASVTWWRSVSDPVAVRLGPDPDGRRRVAFRHLLDLRAEELLPGDTVYYRVEAYDGHPVRGPARSDVFTLRVPTLEEVRGQRAAATEELAEEAQALTAEAEALERAAEEAERRAAGEAASDSVSFSGTEEARAVEEQAGRLQERLDEMRDRLENLREELADSPLSDPALAEQLDELTERLRELMESGLDEQLEALSEALENLDAEQIEEALSGLADRSEWLREQIERTLATLEQAALEQSVKSARAEAESLADEQQRVAETPMDASELASREEALAAEADQLADALDQLEQRLDEQGLEASADSVAAAGEAAREAARSMERAAEQAGQSGPAGEPSARAQQSAQQAADQMEQASQNLGSAAGNLGQENREAAARALSRARTGTLELAQAQADLAERSHGAEALDPEEWRSRQGAIRQGLQNVLRELNEQGGEQAGLEEAAGDAASEAGQQMEELLDRLGDGARRMPSRLEADRIAGSLNDLALELWASERSMRGQAQGAEQEAAFEQMNALAQQQQSLTQESSSLLMPGPRPAGQESPEQRVAEGQQEIAEQLRQLGNDESLLGDPARLAEEAEELARKLEADGVTAETLDRQRALFRRMLDAGRSLEDDDLDPNERESETGSDVESRIPEIDAEALRGRRYPLPGEALLEGLPLFYRPLVFEYFDRLNRTAPRQAPRAGSDGEGSDG